METFIYSTLGLGSFFTIVNLNKVINLLTDKLNTLDKTPLRDPESLPPFIDKLLQNRLLESNGFNINEKNPDEIIGNVFLKGLASTPHPIKSRLPPHVPLIYSNYYVNKLYSNNPQNENQIFMNRQDFLQQVWSSQTDTIVDEAPYFNLFAYDTVDDKNTKTFQYSKKPQYSCRVARNMKIEAKGAARLIGSRFSYKSLSWVERLILFVYLILEAIFSRQSTIKGIRVGYVEHEMGIKNNSLIDVYGKVAYDTKKKTLRMDFPEYFLKNRNAVFNRLMKEIRDKRMIVIFLLIPFMLSAMKLGAKTCEWLKKWNVERKIVNKDKLNMIKKIVIDDVKCSICLSNINNIIVLPCEHFCVCKECYLHRIESKKCPKCESDIKEIIEVFLP